MSSRQVKNIQQKLGKQNKKSSSPRRRPASATILKLLLKKGLPKKTYKSLKKRSKGLPKTRSEGIPFRVAERKKVIDDIWKGVQEGKVKSILRPGLEPKIKKNIESLEKKAIKRFEEGKTKKKESKGKLLDMDKKGKKEYKQEVMTYRQFLNLPPEKKTQDLLDEILHKRRQARKSVKQENVEDFGVTRRMELKRKRKNKK